MSLDISPKTEARLRAAARAEGVSVDTLVEQLIEERDEIVTIVEKTETRAPLSRDEIEAKIERGFAQSEHGEVIDGETFATELLRELDAKEQKRRTGDGEQLLNAR